MAQKFKKQREQLENEKKRLTEELEQLHTSGSSAEERNIISGSTSNNKSSFGFAKSILRARSQEPEVRSQYS